ncbi:MAG: metal dependent phosphohydrolase [Bacteriovoracaceae bacterium]|nr:metal dependent phosphohydrolase [Bacteriovoracaceae bacterium]
MIDLNHADPLTSFAISVVKKLQAAGFEAVFAGGCVRDLLLNKTPKDFDVATNALPDDVRKIFPRTVPVGEAFNVILVMSPEEENPFRVEVATFRADIGIKDGRHPEKVVIATAKEDVQRRDFTINGMLLDPSEGKVLDWVGGQKDLEAGIIRAIGNADLRIEEDHLRMLRAIRFAARFNYKIDPELWSAIQSKASLITKISEERIFEELTKMLTSANADRAFNDLADSGLLAFILPEALAMKGCEQPPEHHPEGDVWVHTMLLLKRCEGVSPELAWGCLLHDIGKPPTFSHEPPDRIRFNNHTNVGAEMAETILRRLKASNHLIEIVAELTRDHLKFKDVPQMRPSTLKRFLRNPNFDLHLKMHYFDCMACHQNLTLYNLCKSELEKLSHEQLSPPPLIGGKDLIALGFKPGPQFKEILESLETEQLEGRIASREDAVEFVKKNYKI